MPTSGLTQMFPRNDTNMQSSSVRKGSCPTSESQSIATGIYIIRNAQSGTVLDVSNGGWNESRIQGWEAEKLNSDPEDLINQRFLVCSNNACSGTVNILSLSAGAYVSYIPFKSRGFFRFWWGGHSNTDYTSQSYNNSAVRGRATCSQSAECLWTAEEVTLAQRDRQAFRFRAYNDTNRLLEIAAGSRQNGALVRAGFANDAGLDSSQEWILEETPMDTGATADWMAQVEPQNTKFSMLSIPGTHQTLAARPLLVSDNPRCQNRSFYLQLCDGIRFVDLRLDLYSYNNSSLDPSAAITKPYLIARHGTRPVFSAWEGYSFSAVLQTLAYFLARHPGETVFLNARMESTPSGNAHEWVRALYEEIEPHKSIFFHTRKRKGFEDLSLDDARGKAILLCDSIRGANPAIDSAGHYEAPVNNIDLFFRPRPRTEVSTCIAPVGAIHMSQWEMHAGQLSSNLAAAGKDLDFRHAYRTGLNSSGLPGISGAPYCFNTWLIFYNPIDFFQWLKDNWMPREMDEGVHPKGARMGLITLDFYELALDFVKFIITRNNGVFV